MSLEDLRRYSHLNIDYVYKSPSGQKRTVRFGRGVITLPEGTISYQEDGSIVVKDQHGRPDVGGRCLNKDLLARLEVILPIYDISSSISKEYGVSGGEATKMIVEGLDIDYAASKKEMSKSQDVGIKILTDSGMTPCIEYNSSKGRVTINDYGNLESQRVQYALEQSRGLVENPAMTADLKDKYAPMIYNILRNIDYLRPDREDKEGWRAPTLHRSFDEINYGVDGGVPFIQINRCRACIGVKGLEVRDAGAFYRLVDRLLDKDRVFDVMIRNINEAKALKQNYDKIASDILQNIELLRPVRTEEGYPWTIRGAPCDIECSIRDNKPYISGRDYEAHLEKRGDKQELVVEGDKTFYKLLEQHDSQPYKEEPAVLTKMSDKINRYKEYDEQALSILKDIDYLRPKGADPTSWVEIFKGHPCDIECGVAKGGGPFITVRNEKYKYGARLQDGEVVVIGNRELFVRPNYSEWEGPVYERRTDKKPGPLTIDTICNAISESKEMGRYKLMTVITGIVAAAAGLVMWGIQSGLFTNMISGGNQDQGRSI